MGAKRTGAKRNNIIKYIIIYINSVRTDDISADLMGHRGGDRDYQTESLSWWECARRCGDEWLRQRSAAAGAAQPSAEPRTAAVELRLF